MIHPRHTLVAALATLLAVPLSAQVGDTCTSAEHRRFDFWQGSWIVYVDSQRVGSNTIASVSGGCALLEQWESVRGTTGTSLNFFDSASAMWHQVWVGEAGNVILRLEGGIVADTMVLRSTSRRETPDGAVFDRIRWYPDAQGHVHQVWEVSPDGENWTEIFHGRYERQSASSSRP